MTRISTKNQITLPVDVMREAGFKPGEELRVRVVEPGRVEIERVGDFIERWAGSMPGVYPDGYLEELRNEWER
jgi:bifunctional DNA-binding transcriptional regulator/antitoxin component of YhaV-PrlF toxin-antitoxin module